MKKIIEIVFVSKKAFDEFCTRHDACKDLSLEEIKVLITTHLRISMNSLGESSNCLWVGVEDLYFQVVPMKSLRWHLVSSKHYMYDEAAEAGADWAVWSCTLREQKIRKGKKRKAVSYNVVFAKEIG